MKGIIFQGDSVRGILEGIKTETRRVVKPQPDYSILKTNTDLEAHRCPQLGPVHIGRKEWGLYGKPFHYSDLPCYAYNCPYGQVGDQLWVRETWGIQGSSLHGTQRQFFEKFPDIIGNKNIIHYAASDDLCVKWFSSIFMPRWASRITLEITEIKVERLQDISVYSCIAEGVPQTIGGFFGNIPSWVPNEDDHFYANRTSIENYSLLWNTINAIPKPKYKNKILQYYTSYPWSESDRDPRETINGVPHHCYPNPWVYALKFRKELK